MTIMNLVYTTRNTHDLLSGRAAVGTQDLSGADPPAFGNRVIESLERPFDAIDTHSEYSGNCQTLGATDHKPT
jgi:hypothetical protein